MALSLSFWLSSRPGDSLPSPVPDYLAHFIEYALLALVAARAFHGGFRAVPAPPLHRVLGPTAVLCLLWAISDELHQSLVPGRVPSVRDLLADLAGVLAACTVFPWLRGR